MTKNMLTLLESILTSTARTVRAVVLILTISLVTGTTHVPLLAREPSSATSKSTSVDWSPHSLALPSPLPSQRLRSSRAHPEHVLRTLLRQCYRV